MKDYKKIVTALRLCSAVNSSCEECPCNDPAEDLCECANRVCIAAADAIENLLTENAALRRQIDNLTSAQAVMVKEFEAKQEELAKVEEERRWISVKDRMPDEKQRVIVRCKTVGTTVGWRLWGEWMTDLGDGGSEVTHWMPLPEMLEKEV